MRNSKLYLFYFFIGFFIIGGIIFSCTQPETSANPYSLSINSASDITDPLISAPNTTFSGSYFPLQVGFSSVLKGTQFQTGSGNFSIDYYLNNASIEIIDGYSCTRVVQTTSPYSNPVIKYYRETVDRIEIYAVDNNGSIEKVNNYSQFLKKPLVAGDTWEVNAMINSSVSAGMANIQAKYFSKVLGGESVEISFGPAAALSPLDAVVIKTMGSVVGEMPYQGHTYYIKIDFDTRLDFADTYGRVKQILNTTTYLYEKSSGESIFIVSNDLILYDVYTNSSPSISKPISRSTPISDRNHDIRAEIASSVRELILSMLQ